MDFAVDVQPNFLPSVVDAGQVEKLAARRGNGAGGALEAISE